MSIHFPTETDGTISRECSMVGSDNTCDKDLCNSDIFPVNRLHCYQCIDCSSTSLQNEAAPVCSIYNDEKNSCYTYYDGKNIKIKLY